MSHTHMWAWLRFCIATLIFYIASPAAIMHEDYCAAYRITGGKQKMRIN